MQIAHRIATISDLSSIYDLYMDKDSNRYLTYDPMPIEKFSPIFENVLFTGTLYVIESGNEVIGSYRLIRKSDRQAHTVYLGGFVVKSTMKGKGIGLQMLEQIKKDAGPAGIKRIELTVDMDNQPAIRLYQKAGFAIEGHIRKSYKLNT